MQIWKRTRAALPILVAVGIVIATLACGGGGGGGGSTGLPVAPDPTCGTIIQRAVPSAAQLAAKFGPNVIVPTTSVPKAADTGLAHTNHLILVRPPTRGIPDPSGLTPAQLHAAYNIPSNSGSKAIAIVDAFNYPTALNDFNVYSSQFGLPTEASSTVTASSNSVFQVVYANGVKPADDAGWSQEMALDMECAHAMAPKAKIYLVEAASSSLDDLARAANVAKKLTGVSQVSLSFGAVEDGCQFATYDKDFIQSGVVFFASSGDDAGSRDFPGESKNVVSVGGTTLNINLDGTWASESAWNGTSCGPSDFEPRPSFQDGQFSLVGKFRGSCDIAAVGDPNTGVSVYDSFPSGGISGWNVFGGTSASCPIVAGIANVGGAAHTSSRDENATLYAGIGGANFHDIKSGSASGFNAGSGWDFPTGVGSPNGIGGF
jgi:kumamolisin